MTSKVDFIIVGQGLAGSALAMALIRRGKSVLVIDRADPDAATRVAAGLVTALAGKGMNPAWRQSVYLPEALAYYRELESSSGEKLFHAQPVLRLFADAKERAKFERKKEIVADWVNDESASVDSSQLNAEFGGFEMAHGGRLDTCAYLRVVREILEESSDYREEYFCEADLEFTDEHVTWNGVEAKKVILCQGFAGLQSGSFSDVEHRSAKGEMLTVRVDDLDDSRILSCNGWMVPLGDNLWRAGATYDWGELDTKVTESGLTSIEKKVAEFTKLPFKTVLHEAGIRPIISRSQPVIGLHAERHQIGFFNGLGSKGVITSPSVGEHFAAYLCGEVELDPELSLARL